MKDTRIILSMGLLSVLTQCAREARPKLMPLLILKMVQLSISHGICVYTPVAFAAYGMILCMNGDCRGGYEMGQAALLLLDKSKTDSMVGRVHLIVYGHINCWTKPVFLTTLPLINGYQKGMATGDVGSAMMCLVKCVQVLFYSGHSLTYLKNELEQFCSQMKEYKQNLALGYASLFWQMVLNMMGGSENPVVLTGTVMTENEIMEESKHQSILARISILHFNQMTLYYHFGDIRAAAKVMMKTKFVSNFYIYGHLSVVHEFFGGLVSISLAQEKKCKRCLRIATKKMKIIEAWSDDGNVNCRHMVALLKAEIFQFKGDTDEAERNYRYAITTTHKCGFIHDRALANERMGIFYCRIGSMDQAQDCLLEAYKIWLRWGARAKAENLMERYAGVLDSDKCRDVSERPPGKSILRGDVIVSGPLLQLSKRTLLVEKRTSH